MSENTMSDSRVRRGWHRFSVTLAVVTLILTLLSPFVVRLVLQHINRVKLEHNQLTQRLTKYMILAPLPELSLLKYNGHDDMDYWVALFRDSLREKRVHEENMRLSLLKFKSLYQQSRWLLGGSQTHVWVRLLVLEMRAESRGKVSLFYSPDAALESSRRWFALIHTSLNAPIEPRNPIFVEVLASITPSISVPEVVALNSRDILSAAHLTHLSPGLLAAVVDNEQAGGKLAYGLSGGIRQMAANIAQHESIAGNSGIWRHLSHNLGLTQMSWEDAEKQGPRLKALGINWITVPHNEFEARQILRSPRLNVLFAASRLRGYLNAYYNRPSNDTRPYTDAWLYVIGLGWHNRPEWMVNTAVWNYTWNGFFKAALYEHFLSIWASR